MQIVHNGRGSIIDSIALIKEDMVVTPYDTADTPHASMQFGVILLSLYSARFHNAFIAQSVDIDYHIYSEDYV